MPTCRLCRKHHPALRNSHIVPEFLYRNLYNEKRHMMAIRQPQPRHGASKVLQKGIREPLFCESCEQHFNEHFEKPFLDQWSTVTLPDPWETDRDSRISVDDYSSFKLFHLSVLFRASVSSLPTYDQVALGPHESVLRQLLLDRNPGDEFEYPVCGQAVVHHRSRRLVQAITRPELRPINSHRYYAMAYGGIEWWIKVSSHRHKEFQHLFLRPDGTILLSPIPWNELPAVRFAAMALRAPRA